jgi:hypothetical protein
MIDTKAEKIQYGITWVIRLTLILAIIIGILKTNLWTISFATLTLLLSFLPAMIKKNLKVDFPIEFELVVTIFIYLSIFAGETLSFYHTFWWWDIMLHAMSGFILALIGFMIVYAITLYTKTKMTPIIVAIFTFSFALAIGAIWEIFEWVVDLIFKTQMQGGSLFDTMFDLVLDTIGAVIISILAYLHTKKGDSRVINKLICRFLEENPHLRKKQKKC